MGKDSYLLYCIFLLHVSSSTPSPQSLSDFLLFTVIGKIYILKIAVEIMSSHKYRASFMSVADGFSVYFSSLNTFNL